MTSMIPMAMFGQEVPPGDVAIKAEGDIPATFRITMAAIDPSAVPEGEEGQPLRATLKVIRQPLGMDDEDDYDSEDDEDDDEFDVDRMDAMFAGGEDEDDDEDEDLAGGPSDPAKSKKARVEAMIRKLAEEEGMDVDDDEDDEDDADDAKPNGVNGVKSVKSKGKMPIGDDEDEDDDEDDSDLDSEDMVEEFVICTLDPEKNYQQPLDITIGEDEHVFFKVSGTHSIFLTGNYVEPANGGPGMYDPDDDEDEDYDLEPDMDELDDDEEEDELDDMEDPRITEIDEDEVPPKLIEMAIKKEKVDNKKGNKRPAEDEAQTLDEMIKDASTNGDAKLSKKQLKKMKKNDGTAAAVEDKSADASSAKSDKKVQFAKELEQGPTPTKDTKAADKPAAAEKKDKNTPSLGPKTVQGVTLDDKKLGTGPAAKSGDRVGMRYIGKLQKDNKVFDSNKKGKPFTFKLGAGEVIKGWDIGIQGMSVGGERRVTIPAHLAYGSKGAGKDIPPNSTLVFDVKLLELNKSK